MKVTCDSHTDTLTVFLREGVMGVESDEEGNLVSLEILDASKRVTETRKIEFQTVE